MTSDAKQVVFFGCEKNRHCRSYILDLPDGRPRPIPPEGTHCYAVPGQGGLPCVRIQDDQGRTMRVWELRSLDGRETRPAPWIGQNEHLEAWSIDGRYAFVAGRLAPPFRVSRVDVATKRREPWLDSSPPDPAGVHTLLILCAFTPDGRYYAYDYPRTLSELFLVEGLR